ncbi:peptide deformylase, partial [Fangia hongkongensis]
PIISIVDDQKTGFWEGCLSVPGIRGCVERASAIKVEYLDETANAQSLYLDDFRAVVFQHELDHLFGVVFLDRITDTTKIAFQEEFDQFISPAQS